MDSDKWKYLSKIIGYLCITAVAITAIAYGVITPGFVFVVLIIAIFLVLA